MAKTILAAYWRSEELLLNLGDYLTEWLIREMGYEFLSYDEAQRTGRLAEFESCALMVGSILDADWFENIKMPKTIWGAGAWGDERFNAASLAGSRVLAVRGPLTQRALGLPDTIPLGDPALLLGQFLTLDDEPHDGLTIYVPHFHSRDLLPKETLSTLGADEFVDIAVTREDFEARITRIGTAGFVLTSSLHGAIIAQTFQRPWALVCPPGSRHDKPGKWDDWFAYLGLETAMCADIHEARRWWQSKGQYGMIRDVRPLLESFPHP